MEECKTPTFQQIGFLFNITPKMVNDVNRLQEVKHLRVNKFNMRCFTPTQDDFRSPGLSPICVLRNIKFDQSPAMKEPEFKTPNIVRLNNRYEQSPNEPVLTQQQIKKNSEAIYSNTPKSISLASMNTTDSLSLSFKSPNYNENNNDNKHNHSESQNSSSFLEITNNSDSQYLNHGLSIGSVLKGIGLVKYAEIFEKSGIDLNKFMSMKPTDLHRLGIQSEEHRMSILELVKELNTTM